MTDAEAAVETSLLWRVRDRPFLAAEYVRAEEPGRGFDPRPPLPIPSGS